MNDKDIIDIFYTNKNKINSHLTNDTYLNKHLDIKQYLLNRYSDSLSIKETIYRIKNNIEIRPVCPVCGNNLKFLGGSKGFRNLCSVSCSKHFINIVNDINDKNIILNDLVINGELNFNKLQEKYIKEHGYYNYLNSIYPNSICVAEKIYRLYYNIETIPLCKECGKPLIYKNFNIGYGEFCNNICKEHYNLRNKNITDNDIINLLFDNNKPIFVRFEKRFLITNHIYEYILNRYKDSTSISETIYRIKNNIEQRPICKVCGKPAKFIKYELGFANTCSQSCTYIYNSSIEKEADIIIDDNYIKEHYLSSNNKINAMQLRKIQLMNDGTYNYLKNRFENCGIHEAVYKIKNNIEETPVCPICGNKNKFKNIHVGYSEYCSGSCALRSNNIKKYQKLGYNIEYKDENNLTIKNGCTKHGNITVGIQTFRRRLNSGEELCPICNPHNTTTIEDKIIKILEKHNIKYYIHDRYQIYPLELDLFLPEYNIGIECNGIYWHSDYNNKNILQHNNKFNICEKHNIKLLSFWENDINQNIDKIESIICNICKVDNQIINAEDCIINEISNNEAKEFLNSYHLQNNISASIKYGLFYNNELLSVMIIGKIKKPSKNNQSEYELYRVCTKSGYIIDNGYIKLLDYFKDHNKWKSIIAYSQNDLSDKDIYENMKFIFVKNCDPDYCYYDRTCCNKINKSNIKKYVNNKNGKTIDENAKLLGYLKCWNSGSKKYIMYNN